MYPSMEYLHLENRHKEEQEVEIDLLFLWVHQTNKSCHPES